MGHAGAIVSGGAGTAQEKIARFERAGVPVARVPSEIPALIAAALAKSRKRASLKVVLGGRGLKKSGARKPGAKKPVMKVAKKAAKKAAKPAARKSSPAKAASKRKAGAKKGRR